MLGIPNDLLKRISGRAEDSTSVYTYNGGQQLIRKFTQPTNPDTTEQQVVRSIFSALTKQWATLSSAQRDAWETWAAAHPVKNRLGNTVKRTGLTAFVQLGAIVQMRTGAAPSGAAPTLPVPSAPSGIEATEGTPDQYAVSHGYSTLTGLFLMMKMTDMLGTAAQNPRIPDYRMISGPDSGSFKALGISGVTYDFTGVRYTVSDQARFGIWAQIVNTEGAASEPFYRVVTYVA